MIDISCKNYFSTTGQSGYQTANRSKKSGSNDIFKTKVVGDVVYIEQTSGGKSVDWGEMNKRPWKYDLKDGSFISHHWLAARAEFRFYHAAESTEENPVLVARGVDEYGMYFEEKIDVKKINPYNTSKLELDALSLCNREEYSAASNPYDCVEGQEMRLRERFNYVAGAQKLIKAWSRIGYAGQAVQWRKELDFLLGYTENIAEADGVKNDYRVNAVFCESISGEYKRNMELYCNAARERLAANMINKLSKI